VRTNSLPSGEKLPQEVVFIGSVLSGCQETESGVAGYQFLQAKRISSRRMNRLSTERSGKSTMFRLSGALMYHWKESACRSGEVKSAARQP
jgi:hypothetical protein